MFFVQGLEEVIKPSLWHRLLGWISVVAGGIGMISSLMAFLAERRQNKPKGGAE